MRLTLTRRWAVGEATIGELAVDGEPECFTCEDRVQEPKIAGQTAIPAGTYRVTVTHSPRFGVELPLLLDVPGFEGVRIHPGNTPRDTEGCILVGQTHEGASVGRSRLAFIALFAKLKASLLEGEPCAITVTDAFEDAA